MRTLILCWALVPLWLHAQTDPSPHTLQTETVYFDFGQHALLPEAEEAITGFATAALAMTDAPGFAVRLTAHTDSVGTDTHNDALSARRAAAVRRALVAAGLPAEAIQTAPFGRRQPVADNDTEEGRRLNRRVTMELLAATPTDEYSGRVTEYSGRITDTRTGEGLQAQLLTRTEEGDTDSLSTDETGRFSFKMPEQTAFELSVFATGYFFETLQIRADEGEAAEQLHVRLSPAKKGDAADIKNLYFVGNEAVLLERSLPELPKLLRFLQMNPELKVEIAGHINRPNSLPVSKGSSHFILSENRAKTVYEYLTEHGIPASQLSYKGYGNSEMRYPTARSEREQELNRRVEIRILSTGEKLGTIGDDGY